MFLETSDLIETMNETINYDKRLNGVLNQNIGLMIQRVP